MLNKIHSYFATSKFYSPPPMTLPRCSLPLILGQSCPGLWCGPLRRHTEQQEKKRHTHIKITRGRGSRRGEKNCVCDKGEGRDKGEMREREKRKKMITKSVLPEVMLYVYKGVKFPESEA